ncbi:hypothetical protein FPOA_13154 [Fusarium poae]|uniref:Uncharacterized protein n=1 Tax=Fusarium poae TaxID=36050 RepID=A0A1B8A6F7_FUSPO|nr:hypothetical protein FPOA_13154 [Fusarium poae]
MSFSDNGSFTHSYDPFLLVSSSPPLPSDPPSTDTPWTPSITEQPSSDGIFGPVGLHGEGLDWLQDYSENLELACIEQMNLVDTERTTLDMPEHVDAEFHVPTVPDTGIPNAFVPSSNIFPEDDPMIENYMGDDHPNSSCLELMDGGVAGTSVEGDTVIGACPYKPHQFDDPSTLARIINMETKIEELLKWKAQQTKRGTELKEMMDDILEMLHGLENRLNSDK